MLFQLFGRMTVKNHFTFILSARFVNQISLVSTGFFRFFPVLFEFRHIFCQKSQQNDEIYFFKAFVSCPFWRSIA